MTASGSPLPGHEAGAACGGEVTERDDRMTMRGPPTANSAERLEDAAGSGGGEVERRPGVWARVHWWPLLVRWAVSSMLRQKDQFNRATPRNTVSAPANPGPSAAVPGLVNGCSSRTTRSGSVVGSWIALRPTQTSRSASAGCCTPPRRDAWSNPTSTPRRLHHDAIVESVLTPCMLPSARRLSSSRRLTTMSAHR